jgi:hypothetical protein
MPWPTSQPTAEHCLTALPLPPPPPVHPGPSFLAAHQEVASRRLGAMTLAERQLVSRGYARLQQLADGGGASSGDGGAEDSESEVRGQAAGSQRWSSRPAAVPWGQGTADAMG